MSNIPIYNPQIQTPGAPQSGGGGSGLADVAQARSRIGSQILAGASQLGSAIASKRHRDATKAKQQADEIKREQRRKEAQGESIEKARADAFDTHVAPILANAIGEEVSFIEAYIADPNNHTATISSDLMGLVQNRMENFSPTADLSDALEGPIGAKLFDRYAMKEGDGDIGPSFETRKRRNITEYYNEVMGHIQSPDMIKRLSAIERDAVEKSHIEELNKSHFRIDSVANGLFIDKKSLFSDRSKTITSFDSNFSAQVGILSKSIKDTYPHSIETARSEMRGRLLPYFSKYINSRRSFENFGVSEIMSDPNTSYGDKANKLGAQFAKDFNDLKRKIDEMRENFTDPKMRSEFNDAAKMMEYQWKRSMLDTIRSYSIQVPLFFEKTARDVTGPDPKDATKQITYQEAAVFPLTLAQKILQHKDLEQTLRLSGDSNYMRYDDKGHGTNSEKRLSYGEMYRMSVPSSRRHEDLKYDKLPEVNLDDIWSN